MKKKIFGMALAAMSLVAFSSNAQTCPSTPCAPKQDCSKVCSAKPCSPAQECLKSSKGNCLAKSDRYEGMNLTEEQKTRLHELNVKRMADIKEKKAAHKLQQKQAKAESKEACRAARKASRQAYLEEVKAIVGPENYIIFLENSYKNGGNRTKDAKVCKGNKKAKDSKSGKRNAGAKRSVGAKLADCNRPACKGAVCYGSVCKETVETQGV